MQALQDDPKTLDLANWAAVALGAALAVCLVLLWPATARATVLEKMDTASISRRAARIVVGTVVSTSVETFEGSVRTVVRMNVSDPVKGGATGTTFFYVPGGDLAGRRVVVDGMASFAPGESAAVFIDRSGWVVGGYQGKVAVAGGRVLATGQRLSIFTDAVKAAIASSKAPVVQGLVDPVAADPQAAGVTAAGGPAISSITPGTVSAGIGDHITITGSGFGASRGTVGFYYRAGQPRITATVIDSWTDTSIVCEVPVAIVNGYPASPGSGPVVVTTAAGAASPGYNLAISFGNGTYRWAARYSVAPTTRVSYRVNPGGVALAESLVDVAADVWNNAGANFGFVDGGTTTLKPGTANFDGYNDIGFAGGLPDGVIAQASYGWVNGSNLTECHVVFSTAFPWGDGSGSTMDIESIAMHEIGHWLCLRDLYGSGDTSKVMYGFASNGLVRRTLTAGDVAGINWIYGAAPRVSDDTPPVTVSNATTAYVGTAVIHLTATDPESGVAGTWYSLDDAAPVQSTSVIVSEVGTHTLDYWSVDGSGNTETGHEVEFEVSPGEAVASSPVTMVQRLTAPVTPSKARRHKAFTASGSMAAPVAVGTRVTLRFYRYEKGHWRLRKTVTASAYDSATGSRFTKRVSLTSKGTWRVRAYSAGTYSPYRKLKVR